MTPPRRTPPRLGGRGASAACSFSASACAACAAWPPSSCGGGCLRFLISWGFSKYLRRRVCGKEGSREGAGSLGRENKTMLLRHASRFRFLGLRYSPRTRPGGGARGREDALAKETRGKTSRARPSARVACRATARVVQATGTHLVDVTGRHHRPAEATNRGLPVLVLADGNLGVRGRGEEGSAPAGYDSSASRVSGGVSRLGTARHGSRGLWARPGPRHPETRRPRSRRAPENATSTRHAPPPGTSP